jgi:hypothetical protein
MKAANLLRFLFPEVLLTYFDVTDYQEQSDRISFWLDEKESLTPEDASCGTIHSYGFTPARVIQDFPLRGKSVFLHVRRRKWRDSSSGDIFSYTYDDLTAEGTKLTSEFVAFLKDTD